MNNVTQEQIDDAIKNCYWRSENRQSSQGRKPTTLEWWEECPF